MFRSKAARLALGGLSGFFIASAQQGTVLYCKEEEKKKEPKKPVWPPGSRCYPKFEYGEWVANWDGLGPHPDASDDLKKKLRKAPVRHVILIRHGQYDLEFKGDPPLTDLGKDQAKVVAERILQWTKDDFKSSPSAGVVNVKVNSVVSSNILRAKQTGQIIADVLGVNVKEEDPLLAEGVPCPCDTYAPSPREMFEDSARIEAAFRKYIHRSVDGYSAHAEPQDSYEGPPIYDVISCHGNVIRYFMMRALQLPPDAWLRTATFNTGITHLVIRPTGRVSLVGFGDVGHLGLDRTTYH